MSSFCTKFLAACKWFIWFVCKELFAFCTLRVTVPKQYRKRQWPMTVILLVIVMCCYYWYISPVNDSTDEDMDRKGWCRWSALAEKKYYWTLITFNFVHGAVEHLLGNAVPLFFYGVQFNRIIGNLKFICIFFTCSTIAALFKLQLEKNPDSGFMGASAGVFGIAGALCAFIFIHWDRYGPGKRLMISIALIPGLAEIYSFIKGTTTEIPGRNAKVSHDAHAIGFIVGVCFSVLFLRTLCDKQALQEEKVKQEGEREDCVVVEMIE